MRRYEPQTRYSVSKTQEDLLLFILKYRFVTSDLLADILSKDRSTIYERLSVLVDQGYLVKLYDKTYRLRQRPVIYHLAPAGIRYLKAQGVERTQLHYKNRSFSDEQINEQLLLANLARAVRAPYRTSHKLYTKYQLNLDDLYISPPPYAKLEGVTDAVPDYLIEYFPDFHPTWKIRKRINQHIEFADDYGYIYPHLLLICGNASTEKRVVRMTQDTYTDFEIFVTTQERILNGKSKIWLNPIDFDEDDEPEYQSLPIVFEE